MNCSWSGSTSVILSQALWQTIIWCITWSARRLPLVRRVHVSGLWITMLQTVPPGWQVPDGTIQPSLASFRLLPSPLICWYDSGLPKGLWSRIQVAPTVHLPQFSFAQCRDSGPPTLSPDPVLGNYNERLNALRMYVRLQALLWCVCDNIIHCF